MENENLNVFDKLSKINVNDKVKAKMGLSYLSWSDAWFILKKTFPDAFYTIYTRKVVTKETRVIRTPESLSGVVVTEHTTSGETGNDKTTTTTGGTIETTVTEETENELPYFTDGKTCFVKVGVTIQGHEEVEIFPVMNNKNASINVKQVTSMDVNKALQRAFVKACARHGLGLYIYSGEDLPDAEKVNFRMLIAEANKLKITTESISEDEFTKEREIILKTLGGVDMDAELSAYIGSLFKVRVSQAAYANDSVGIQRLYYVINKAYLENK